MYNVWWLQIFWKNPYYCKHIITYRWVALPTLLVNCNTNVLTHVIIQYKLQALSSIYVFVERQRDYTIKILQCIERSSVIVVWSHTQYRSKKSLSHYIKLTGNYDLYGASKVLLSIWWWGGSKVGTSLYSVIFLQ